MTGTILSYRGDDERPRADVMLANGERVVLTLSSGGMSIATLNGSSVFKASSAQVAHLLGGLLDSDRRLETTPLQVLLGVIVRLPSIAAVQAAFAAAANRTPA